MRASRLVGRDPTSSHESGGRGLASEAGSGPPADLYRRKDDFKIGSTMQVYGSYERSRARRSKSEMRRFALSLAAPEAWITATSVKWSAGRRPSTRSTGSASPPTSASAVTTSQRCEKPR
jgi:hypothetical protein